jgi:RNA polymerase sigma factor FliA
VLENAEHLWTLYMEQQEPHVRDELVEGYQYLVGYVVKGFNSVNKVLESTDLFSFGVIGLIEAISRYDPSQKIAFNTFAIHRIRGAILDGLRKVEWAPRSIQSLTKKSLQAMFELEQELERPPSEHEIAAKLGIKVEEYRKYLDTTNARKLVSLQDLLDGGGELKLKDTSNDDTFDNEFSNKSFLKKEIKNALLKLPSKEKLIITLYFYEGLNLNDIASVLSVSESRVSQMRSQALLRLREALSTEITETM